MKHHPLQKIKMLSLFLGLFIILVSCNSDCTIDPEISKIPTEVEVLRFDKQFAEATPETLPALKQAFPGFFPSQVPDSIWVAKMQDTIQQELDSEVAKIFPDFMEETNDLRQLFQHLKHYFPDFEVPTVITVTSEVDYRNRVIIAGDKLLISLDTYLGTDHPFYVGMQLYLKDNFRKQQIVPNVAQEYAKQLVPPPNDRTFLAYLIYYGKQLYLQDKLLPCTSDAEKIGYNDKQMNWANVNEEQVWRYFIDRELLYKTDTKLQERFLNEGPFSKFYLELDAESPSRIGQYMGWQMVRQYMDKNPVSLDKMLTTSAEKIFKESKYKPEK